MKTHYCKRCGVYYSRSGFFADTRGHWICRVCRKNTARKYYEAHKTEAAAAAKAYQLANPGYAAKQGKLYRERHPAKVKKAAAARYQRDRIKCNARVKVWQALKTGKLTKGPCSNCGSNIRVQAHHENYDQPLEVMWLCTTCHVGLHRKLK